MKNAVDGTTWSDTLSAALRAFKLGDLKLAEQRLDKAFAATKDPKALSYLNLLAGHVAHARGAWAEAEKAWIRVKDNDPENAEAWNNLGVLYRRQGDSEKALAAFREAEVRAPDRPDIPYNIGNLHKSAGRDDEAVSAYNRSIEIDPQYAPAYNNLGTLYETRKEREKALEVFRRGLNADTGDASLRFNMGLVYQEEGKLGEAREAFDRALKSRPGWTPGLNNLGIVLQEMGREDEAARTFRTLLDIEPDNISALNNLGVAYDRLGRSEEARKCFRKALKAEPDYIKAALNLHDSFRDSQELNEALEEINKQITHHPRDPEVRVRMGRTLMGLTRWDEAEQSFDHVLERNPEHREALRSKAELYLATTRPDEAEEILKRLPHDPDAVRDLARLYISTDRADDAERLLNELSTINPDDTESRRLLADLLAETRPEAAVKLREEVVETEPGNTEDLVSLAELYGRNGEKDAALAKLDEAVNLLGSRGEADDLDALNDVLSLYEKAAAALDEEKGELFAERSAQLSRKLNSAFGGGRPRSRKRSIAGEIPLEQEDALSLLDLNAMEPVIRINEEEETVYLEESAEDLEEAWTELDKRERIRDEAARSAAQAAPSGEGGSGGPPVHIHLPSQAAGPVPPKVVYQEFRQAPPRPETGGTPEEMIVEEIVEEEIPVLDDEDSLEIELEDDSDAGNEEFRAEELELSEEDLLGDGSGMDSGETEAPAEEEDDEDEPFFIPESDALSEDLPEQSEPVLPDADLVFSDGGENIDDMPLLDDGDEDLILVEDFAPEPETGTPEFSEDPETPLNEEETEEAEEIAASPAEPEIDASPAEESPQEEPGLDTEKMAEMFKYLSLLTDETTGSGRQQLIDDGIPLKLAGLHARLSGEPNFREVARKFDRRSRERHNLELNEDRIRESLNAFRSLAEAFPQNAVRESLSQKLGRVMNGVLSLHETTVGNSDQSESGVSDDGSVPRELLAGLTGNEEELSSEEVLSAHEDFAAVLPDIEEIED